MFLNVETSHQNRTAQKTKSKKPKTKLFATFVALCVGAATVQSVFYIPVFSDIFSPVVATPTPTPVPPTPTPPTPASIKFSFSDITSTSNQITATLSLDAEPQDYAAEQICLYLIKTSDFSPTFLDGIDEKTKSSNRVDVTKQKVTATFTQSLGSGGGELLLAATSYTLVVTQKAETKATQVVSTTKIVKCIDGISQKTTTDDASGPNHYLWIQPVPNSQFQKFSLLMVELEDVATHSVEFQGILSKEVLESGGWALLTKKKTDAVQTFKVHVYCSTDKPELIEYASTKIKDEITFYLIYTYEGTISF